MRGVAGVLPLRAFPAPCLLLPAVLAVLVVPCFLLFLPWLVGLVVVGVGVVVFLLLLVLSWLLLLLLGVSTMGQSNAHIKAESV